ncbi:hypothetical protein JCM6882_001894 [Rhodosporidiobolus microsporus]
MSQAPQTRSLYRSFLRELGRLCRPHRPDLVNLRRLYRPQLREALLGGEGTLKSLGEQFDRTLSLLRTSPRFRKNLSSLSYHHTPYRLPNADNSARLSHLPRDITWKPQDPSAAAKAWERRTKEEEKDEAMRIGKAVHAGLMSLWKEAEKEAGGVFLGRIEQKRYGGA